MQVRLRSYTVLQTADIYLKYYCQSIRADSLNFLTKICGLESLNKLIYYYCTTTGWSEILHMDHKEGLFYTYKNMFSLEKCEEMHCHTYIAAWTQWYKSEGELLQL